MYEEKNFDNLMEQGMAAISGVDTSEGSLVWNAVATAALIAEEQYAQMDRIWENMFVDTQDLEYLIETGAEAGVFIIEATAAVFEARMDFAPEIGDRFSHVDQEYNYTVIEIVDEEQGLYKLECEEAGTEPNKHLGEIEPIEFVQDYEYAELTRLLIPGADQEDAEAYRQRRLEVYEYKSFGGNRAYYKQELKAIAGVGGIKAQRRQEGEETLGIIVISSDFAKPTDDFIAALQERIDPDLSGEGEGVAPIDHKVRILPVDEIPIHIDMDVELDEGFTIEALKPAIESGIESYLKSLAEQWERSSQLVVRISQIETAATKVDGVLDATGTMLNGLEQNIKLGMFEIPKKGPLNVTTI